MYKKINLILLIIGLVFLPCSSYAESGGDGISALNGEIAVDLKTVGEDAVGTAQSVSGMEFESAQLTLLQGCADNQILKWDEAEDDWNCEADGGGGMNSFDAAGDGGANQTISDGNTLTLQGGLDIVTTGTATDIVDFGFNYSNTQAGNPALGAEECVFTTDGTGGGGILCEGTTADLNEGLIQWNPTTDKIITLPDATDTLVGRATTDTLTNKTINTASNTITVAAADISDLNASTDITADLEEESHASEHDGDGTVANGEAIDIDLIDDGDAQSATSASESGLETVTGELGLIRGCGDNQVLSWQEGTGDWACTDDADTDTTTKGVETFMTETAIDLAGSGTIFISLDGQLSTTEDQIQIPMPTSTLSNLRCSPTATVGGTTLDMEFVAVTCGSAGTFSGDCGSGEMCVRFVTASNYVTVIADTDSLSVTANQCVSGKITDVGNTNEISIGCSYERTDAS